MRFKYVFFFILFFTLQNKVNADTITVDRGKVKLLQDNQILTFTDYTDTLPFKTVKGFKYVFRHHADYFPDFGFSKHTHWLRFSLFNATEEKELLIKIHNPNLNFVKLYYPIEDDGNYDFVEGGNLESVTQHMFSDQDNVFEVSVPVGSTRTFFLKVKSFAHIIVPVSVGTQARMVEEINRGNWNFGLYMGSIIIILLFNLAIYFVLKDKTYLYYVVYIFFLGFLLFSVYGYGYKFLWSNYPYLTLQSISLPKIFMAITMILFLRSFLQTRKTLPLIDTIGQALFVLCIVLVPVSLLGYYNVSLVMTDILLMIICVVYLIGGIKLSRENFRPARYFMLAWSILIAGMMIDIFKDMNVIPFTLFTKNALLISSDIEILLLSFALAEKINIYKEGEISAERKALKLSREKEQLIAHEKVRLEVKVKKRTERLQKVNEELETAMKELKATQNKLIHSEKMASIGKLTAGIAHEINNPINYIQSNVNSLQRDVEELWELIEKYRGIDLHNLEDKQKEIAEFIEKIELDFIREEMKELINGIKEGVSRTSEIVAGLRKFSRMDGYSYEKADINKTIDSAHRLVRSSIPANIEVVKNYENMGEIECCSGLLCQVFMNIMVNGVQAMSSNGNAQPQSGKLTITTKKENESVKVSIRDTGTGIDKKSINNIFDPFFTTKEVGKGTGLGLSITYGIIKKMNGDIKVFSEEGEGAEFVIILPVQQQN